jgi:repressor LexA
VETVGWIVTSVFGGMAVLLPLSIRQKEVLAYLRSSLESRGYPPTIREIGVKFEITSPNGVMCHLRALEKKGYIKRTRLISRAITLVTAS